MKSVLFSLLASIVGLAMVTGGIFGVVNDVKGDDKKPSTRSAVEFSTPVVPGEITPSAGECDQVAKRDARLAHLDNLALERTGDETGSVQTDLICNGDTVVLSMRLSGLKAKETTTYFAWLYRGRRRAEQVGTLIGSDGGGIGSVTMGPTVDTTKYDSLVITRVPFGQTESRPRTIVFRAEL